MSKACFLPLVVALSLFTCGPSEAEFFRRLHELSGPGAIDCGHVGVTQPRAAALSCFQSALRADRPFRVSVATYGLETIITVATVRTPAGELMFLAHDPDVTGGNGWIRRSRIWVEPCLSPHVVLDKDGSYSRMPLSCEPVGPRSTPQ